MKKGVGFTINIREYVTDKELSRFNRVAEIHRISKENILGNTDIS